MAIAFDPQKLAERIGGTDIRVAPSTPQEQRLARILTDSAPNDRKSPFDNWENAMFWAEEIYEAGWNDGIQVAIEQVERDFQRQSARITEGLRRGLK